MPYCQGICIRVVHKKKLKEKWYGNGVKRCNFCKVFMKIEGNKCPCCKSTLRNHGRASEIKRGRKMNRID